MAGGDGKFAAVAVAADFVGVAFALGAGHGEGAIRNEFANFGAMAVMGHVATLGLGDFEEVASNAGEIDGLSGRGAGVGDGHFLRREIEDAQAYSQDNEDADELAHVCSVSRGRGRCKKPGRDACQRNTPGDFSALSQLRLLDSSHAVLSGSFETPEEHDQHDCVARNSDS